MKLLLKRDEKARSLLGGKKYTLVAKVEMTAVEYKAYSDFSLAHTLLYKDEANTESFRQYGSTGGNNVEIFARLLLKRKTPQITAHDLVTGMTFEDDYVLSIIDIQSKVVQAANVFDAAVKSALEFLGERALDLPVV